MLKTILQRIGHIGAFLSARAAARKRKILREIECRRLRRIRRRTVPQYRHCKNCGTELQGMYCHKCGQYALDPQQPFRKYVVQYFENVYQFDGKVWTTLWMLVRRPGFLTCEFNSGKIASYVHPMRLLMFISVVFFVFFFPMLNEKVGSVLHPSVKVTERIVLRELAGSDRTRQPAEQIPDSLLYTVTGLVADSTVVAGVPSLIRIMDCVPATDAGGARADTLTVRMMRQLADRQIYTEIGQRNGLPLLQFNPLYVSSAEARIVLFKERLIGFLSGYAAMIVLLFIPVLACLLRVFYRRCGMMYMGHLVFSLHYVSFLFLLLSLFLLVGEWWMYHMVSSLVFLLAGFLYFVFASHEVYRGTGWFKASHRTLWILLLYTFVVTLVLVFIVAAASYHEKQLLYDVFFMLDGL